MLLAHKAVTNGWPSSFPASTGTLLREEISNNNKDARNSGVFEAENDQWRETGNSCGRGDAVNIQYIFPAILYVEVLFTWVYAFIISL